jgi:hypothetical protein
MDSRTGRRFTGDGCARPLPAAVSGLRHAGAADRRAENEANYCPTCQTGGKLLADRASRLLKGTGRRPSTS